MDKYKKMNLDRLKQAIGKADLTHSEKKTLEWLAEWETETIEDIVSIIKKARKTEELHPKTEKHLVYPVVIFFNEETGRDTERRYARSYAEAIKIKREIYDLYDPDEIESVVIEEEPEIHEFFSDANI